jgi:hypothetical protein
MHLKHNSLNIGRKKIFLKEVIEKNETYCNVDGQSIARQ